MIRDKKAVQELLSRHLQARRGTVPKKYISEIRDWLGKTFNLEIKEDLTGNIFEEIEIAPDQAYLAFALSVLVDKVLLYPNRAVTLEQVTWAAREDWHTEQEESWVVTRTRDVSNDERKRMKNFVMGTLRLHQSTLIPAMTFVFDAVDWAITHSPRPYRP